MTNDPNPPKPDMSGFIRLLAEAIADKIIEDEKRALLGLGEHETAQEPTEPPSVQGKEREGRILADVEPRPPPFAPSNHKTRRLKGR